MNKFESPSEEKLSFVYPDLAVRWRRVAEDMWNLHEKRIRVTAGFRSFKEQWEVWGKGRKKEKNGQWTIVGPVVTHAMPGHSLHQYGLAIDSCFVGPDPYLEGLEKTDPTQFEFFWKEYGRFCKAHGLEWGGDWSGKKKDRPHCQILYGLSLSEIQTLFEHNGLKAIWAKCDQLLKCGVELV